MTARISQTICSLFLLIAGLLALPNLALAGGGTATGTPPGANSPVQAVRALLHGYVYVGNGHRGMHVVPVFRACSPMTIQVLTCPLSPRLLNRLRHPDPIPAGCLGSCTVDPVSRAQNTTYWIAIRVVSHNGKTAVVATRWAFDAGKYALTYTVVHNAAGWQVDDAYCPGRPETTIYKLPVRPCPAM